MTPLEKVKAECRRVIELANMATPGPWEWDGARMVDYGEPGSPDMQLRIPECSWLTGGAFMMGNDNAENRGIDGEFITTSRTFTPAAAKALLATIGALEAAQSAMNSVYTQTQRQDDILQAGLSKVHSALEAIIAHFNE